MYAKVNGEVVASISGDNEKAVQLVAKEFEKEIQEQREDNRNYGLLFYRHGYNGKAQSETKRFYLEEYGVAVF